MEAVKEALHRSSNLRIAPFRCQGVFLWISKQLSAQVSGIFDLREVGLCTLPLGLIAILDDYR